MNERLNPLHGLLKKVALSGSYNDLTDKPAIPTALADLTDGVWKPGDTLQIESLICAGFVTGSTKSINISFSVGKPIRGSAKITALSGVFRGIGGYIEGTGETTDFLGGAYTNIVGVKQSVGIITIILRKSTAYTSATNNTPVMFIGDITLDIIEATGDEPMAGPEMFD